MANTKKISMVNMNVRMDNDTDWYMNQIRAIDPYASREEEQAAVEAAKKDERAFEDFVKHNLKMVVKMANHYANCGLSLADLIGYGNMGLIRAARDYVEHPEYYLINRFSTYAVWHIRKAITDAIEKEGRMVRRTHNIEVNSSKVERYIDRFSLMNGYEPTVEDIAEDTGLDEDDVEAVLVSSRRSVSIDSPMDDDEDTPSLGSTLKGHMNADRDLLASDNGTMVNALMSALTEKERLVVAMSFGIGCACEHRPDDIALETGMKLAEVKGLLEKAMRKMKSIEL